MIVDNDKAGVLLDKSDNRAYRSYMISCSVVTQTGQLPLFKLCLEVLELF